MLNNDLINDAAEMFAIKIIFDNSNDSVKDEAISFVHSLLNIAIGSKNAAQSNIQIVKQRAYWKNTEWQEVVLSLTLYEECSPEDLFASVAGKKDTELYYGYSIDDELETPRLMEELIIVPTELKNIKWIHVYNGGSEPGLALDQDEWLEATKSFTRDVDEDNLHVDLEDELLPLTIVDHNVGFVDEQGVVWSKGPALEGDASFEWDIWLPPLVRPSMQEFSPDGIHMSVKADGEPNPKDLKSNS